MSNVRRIISVMKTKTLVSFCLEIFSLDYCTEKKKTENPQLFDGIIDVTLFDGVEGLDY